MKISVIIPVYNCAEFLPACIESVCNQTHQNLQIILINDGSTDDGGYICDEYAKKDKRITVIHQENAGVSTARNVGLYHASGELVAFVDADDYLDLDMYEFLENLMSKHQADIVHCGYRRIVNGFVELQQNTGELYIQNSDEALYCLTAGKVFHCGLWNKLYRREIIHDLTFDGELRINEDILFNFKAFQKSSSIVYTDTAKYNYIVHPGSACTSTTEFCKATDASKVNRYMLDMLMGTELESIARSRYMRTLSICYRECRSREASVPLKIRNSLAGLIWAEAKTRKISENRMILTAWLIRWMPWFYRFIYRVYAAVRSPKWEPGKIN